MPHLSHGRPSGRQQLGFLGAATSPNENEIENATATATATAAENAAHDRTPS